jgi:hypothetical protein
MTRLALASLLLILFPSVVCALNVTMSTKAEGGDRPVIVGTTNLPDGIELMVTLSRKESSYMGQSKAQVRGGAFRAGPFSQKGAGLNPGIYRIEVSSPLPSLQPPHTWTTIGNDGSKLQGPLVKKSPYGGKVVQYKNTLKIGTGKRSLEQDRAAQAQAEKDQDEWWLRSCKDNCNLVQRVAQERGEAFNWDRCYHKCVADEPAKKK